MQTVADSLKEDGEALLGGIDVLLGDDSPLRNLNSSGSNFVIMGPHYQFGDVPYEKKRLQSQLREQHKHFMAIVRAILGTQSETTQQSIDQWDKTLIELIEQDQLVWHRTVRSAKEAARTTVEEILDAVSTLHDPADGCVILVPDTNALIYSPAFQRWEFENLKTFEILLVPTVLSELDSLKVEHRNPDVRQKAQDVIRQIKEYRRRGALNDGVLVVSSRIRLRSLAVEPQVEKALPWLDPSSLDDRMLASCIEVMRMHSRSTVLLVTGDINLQNKAEFARVPFLEPPA